MYIQEIVIDGFKSYAKRTVIDGFDPMFNAITGLNGSGKSNILDSICFVLGISRLEQVRAGSLQELVYKQGQAGVSRAIVTIVFNNMDKQQSPVGYEAYDEIAVCRQVAIGGRNKYLINGHIAQQNRVQNLFHSVQLNINNPHFLIMQGRITKVINMSPPELLGLIAEAAGTKMYEAKKEAALKTIEKKQAKVEEIHKILAEDITPSLEKLRKERAQYMQWAAGNGECERLQRFCTAWDFAQAEAVTKKSGEEMAAMQQERVRLMDNCNRIDQEIADKEDNIKAMHRAKDQEAGEEVKRLEQAASERSKQLVKDTSAWQHKKEALESERKTRTKAAKALTDLDRQRAAGRAKVEAAEAAIGKLNSEVSEWTTKVAELVRQRQALQAGCDAHCAAGDKTLAEQLREARGKETACKGEAEQLEMKAKHYAELLKGKKAGVKASSDEVTSLQAELAKATAKADALRAEVEATGFDAAALRAAEAAVAEERAAVEALREGVERLTGQLAAYDIKYTPPSAKGFDAGKVKGIVASLIKVKEAEAATALEVACGGKLFQLVVSDEVTGKQLMEGGALKKRVTIIPLNKIDASVLPDGVLRAARKAVGDRASLALELVGYEEEVEAAMKHVFGRTMVCRDVEAAKACAFTDGVRARSVTLEGDLFDPAGTLTGGSRAAAEGSVLSRFGELAEGQGKLAEAEIRLTKAQTTAKGLKIVALRHEELTRKVGLAEHEVSLIRRRLEANPHFRAEEEVTRMHADVTASKAAAADRRAEAEAARARAAALEKQLAEYATSRDSLAAAKDAEVAAAQKRLGELQQQLKTTRDQNEALLLDSDAAAAERAALEEALAAAEAAVERATAEVAAAEAAVGASKGALEEAEGKLNNKRCEVMAADKALSAANKDLEKTQGLAAEQRLAVKKLEQAMVRFEKDAGEAHKGVESMLRAHTWIQTERRLFGKPGTDYDFTAMDPAAAQRRLAHLTEEQERLGKRVNKKVLGMFERAEGEYHEVVGKQRIVEADKRKIEAVISELDERKRAALKATWAKVNRDFSSIFTTLLPNAKARLDPPEGGTVLDGLVLRVGFGDCWKESLSELSGGQRSLLALSLILALLLFKPAPMYILDEIDAALDLSHTQNIGSMLRTHFKKSQFIVVSLKEGMFNNANVLFRTKFVDGVSTVTRTTPSAR